MDILEIAQRAGTFILAFLLVTLVAWLIAVLALRVISSVLKPRIAAHYKSNEILMQDLGAVFYGALSAGAMQMRGNGGLVLTAMQLDFFMAVPKRRLSIPLEAITEVSLTKQHLGKRSLGGLLKVQFSREGKTDAIAWALNDPSAWKARIEVLRGLPVGAS